MKDMKLYGSNVCPFVHRTRLVLAEKGLSYNYVEIDLRNKPEWYHQVLPSGKVPLLEYQGDRVWESSIVCEYLEEAFPEPSLLPTSPGEKARARILIDWISNSFVPLYYKLLKSQDVEEQKAHGSELRSCLETLETHLSGGPFLLGENLSLVDLELYPWFERWPVLRHYRSSFVPEIPTQLAAWVARMSARAAIAAIAEEAESYIQQYRHYAEPVKS